MDLCHVRLRLHLCMRVQVRVLVRACLCARARVRVHVSECTCPSARVRVHVVMLMISVPITTVIHCFYWVCKVYIIDFRWHFLLFSCRRRVGIHLHSTKPHRSLSCSRRLSLAHKQGLHSASMTIVVVSLVLSSMSLMIVIVIATVSVAAARLREEKARAREAEMWLEVAAEAPAQRIHAVVTVSEAEVPTDHMQAMKSATAAAAQPTNEAVMLSAASSASRAAAAKTCAMCAVK